MAKKPDFDKLVQELLDAAVNEGMHEARGTYPMQAAYDRTHAARDALLAAIKKATRGVPGTQDQTFPHQSPLPSLKEE